MLRKTIHILERILETGLWLAMLAMLLAVVWQVFTRYVLHSPSSWTEELSIFLLIWIGLLGSAVALKRKSHLGIDVLVERFTPTLRHLTGIFIYACVAFFSLCVLLYGGSMMVAVVLMNHQISPSLGIRMGYVYLALPISGFFITLFAVEFMAREIVILLGRKEEEEEVEVIKVSLE